MEHARRTENDTVQNASRLSPASKSGYTLIELMLVVALLALFGAATLSLVASGGDAYKGIVEKKDLDTGLRIALSYIDTKVKQNDAKNVLRLENSPNGTGKALVIEEAIDSGNYETWIYQSGGKLLEVMISKGEPVQDDLGFEIAELEGFRMEYRPDKSLLHLKVWNTGKGGVRELETDVGIKTGLSDKSS